MRQFVLASRLLAFALLLSALAFGCAQEREPINRIQADALAKSFFVGDLADPNDDPEFYMRVSVVDVMYGSNSDGLITSTDGQPTVRIRWEITERTLLARLTYELVQDSDRKGAKPSRDGQIVAAFDIQKHFDIRNDYNPSTGEELNVVVENDSDRPWYSREYFRVDWSKNLITDAYSLDTLSQIGMYYGVKWEAVAYYVGDPAHPDAPQFDVEKGYFDVTTKALATPGMIEDEFGSFPACYLIGEWPAANCNPTEVKLRSSFLRVRDTDYEPADWNGEKMEIVGVFSQDRVGYAKGYGIVDDKWHRFAARWNLFERSHTDTPCGTKATTPLGADPHRDGADGKPANGTEDECEAVGRGSRCDVFKQRCTIPVRDRAVRTIPWYVSPGFPPELFDATGETLKAWSDAVRVALLAGRLAECRRTGEQGCEATLAWPQPWADDYVPPTGNDAPAKVPTVFVLCHNPVQGNDALACGAPGSSARLGDLRYNFITHINEPQSQSPWGIMVDAEDPLTGEKISGSVNIWGTRTEYAAAQLADLLMLLQGLSSPTDYIAGKNVSSWVGELSKGGSAARAGGAMSLEELAHHESAFDPKVLEPYLANLPPAKDHEKPQMRRKKRAEALVDLGRLGPGNTALAQRLRKMQNSGVEAQMTSPEMLQLAGHDPKTPASADAIRRASPFGRANPTMRRAMHRRALIERAHRGSCRIDGAAAEPDNLIGLAVVAQKLFGKPTANDAKAVADWREKVFQWARVQYHKGVLAHELGHAMGLRHNFAASFDSLNYDIQYWQLRTHNGTVTEDCPKGTTDGTNCIAPRWRDPISKEELDNNIGMYATTSVMDYPGDPSQDQRLLGKYDRAAVRLIYGDVVDVWAEPGVTVTGKKNAAGTAKAYKLSAFASHPGLTGIYFFPNVDPDKPSDNIHYSQYHNAFKLITGCKKSDAPGAIFGEKCSEQPLDVVDYRDMSPFAENPTYAVFSWGTAARTKDKQGRVRRGYLFSSDEYADAGNVTTFTDDAGADAFEIVRFLQSQYELRYVLDSFRRNRVTFNSADTTWRLQSHYFDPIELIAKTFAFGALLDGDPTAPPSSMLKDGYYGPLALAASVGLDMFAQIITRPQPGYFCSPDEYCGKQPYGVDPVLYSADAAPLPDVYGYNFQVALGNGRYLHNEFDYKQGYWWGDYQTQVGSYYEKVWATYYLSEAFDWFISNSKEDFVDSRYKNVNFATVFPEQVRRLYNSLLTDDFESYAPRAMGKAKSQKDAPAVPVLYPTWSGSDLGTFPKGALLVDPHWGWNARVWAMVWGAMYFPTNWSYDWVHQARIAALPTEQPNWPDDEVYAFSDPKSGLTYRARSSGTEKLAGLTRQKSAGARMLEWANRLLAIAYKVQRDGNGNPVLDKYGRPVLELKSGKPQLDDKNPGAEAVLKAYVDQIDMFRQITATFQQPLEGLPSP